MYLLTILVPKYISIWPTEWHRGYQLLKKGTTPTPPTGFSLNATLNYGMRANFLRKDCCILKIIVN